MDRINESHRGRVGEALDAAVETNSKRRGLSVRLDCFETGSGKLLEKGNQSENPVVNGEESREEEGEKGSAPEVNPVAIRVEEVSEGIVGKAEEGERERGEEEDVREKGRPKVPFK